MEPHEAYVLVVFSEKFNQALARKYLTDGGVLPENIYCFDTVESCLAALKPGFPDVIISGFRFAPNQMTGAQLLEQLRGKSRARVMVSSGTTHPPELDEIAAAGFHGYLAEPWDLDVFLREFARVLRVL